MAEASPRLSQVHSGPTSKLCSLRQAPSSRWKWRKKLPGKRISPENLARRMLKSLRSIWVSLYGEPTHRLKERPVSSAVRWRSRMGLEPGSSEQSADAKQSTEEP